MELHMRSHHWERRMPDWRAAGVSGFAAGAILMVLELLWSWSAAIGASPWAVSHGVAAIVMGPQVLESSAYGMGVVGVALVVHYVLGIVFGMVLGAIIAPFRLDSSLELVLLTGAIYGVALYLFNFYGMVQWFPWFAGMRGWATLLAHVIFGVSAAVMYWKLARHVESMTAQAPS